MLILIVFRYVLNVQRVFGLFVHFTIGMIGDETWNFAEMYEAIQRMYHYQ